MYSKYGKRIFDVTAACLLLLLAAPVLAVVAPVLYILNSGQVIFRQQRPGMFGKPFCLYKLQTMTNACTPSGELLPDAHRLTALGKLLRQTSIDELPQLYNVLRGDLSLVGPRPLLMEYLPLYSPEQAQRHQVRPGITGWAQVNGRNSIDWEQKFALDIWYTQHLSFKTDLRILSKTVRQVWQREGIHMTGYATMPKFKGSSTAS